MLYSCTNMATVGVKGLIIFTRLISAINGQSYIHNRRSEGNEEGRHTRACFSEQMTANCLSVTMSELLAVVGDELLVADNGCPVCTTNTNSL